MVPGTGNRKTANDYFGLSFMCEMIPEKVENFTTKGEAVFYRFLEKTAKPDAQYICWYSPDVEGREPDFLLFSAEAGLIVFEVKDWALDQIVEADPKTFRLEMGGKVEPKHNPFQQARDYLYQVMDLIKEDGRLVSANPAHHGNPKLPISCGVVFPNINKHEYIEKGFDRVIGPDKIFFWDDLHPASDICSDPSGECFRNALKERFGPGFKFKLTGAEIDHLRQLLFPTVRIDLPERRADECLYDERSRRLKCLDHHQEAIARKYENGHRIISGPSGSGKTIVLVHKAAFLKRYNPSIRSILFICYNITLVNYIRRLLAGKEVPFGEDGVQVFHFFELCSKILGQDVNYEGESPDYYDVVVQETLENLAERGMRFDAILVDEGQDFTDDMFKVVSGLLNPKTDNLTIAIDDRQNIYRRKTTWKSVGVKAQGRVYRLGPVYRNTTEIAEFAARFIGDAKGKEAEQKTQLDLFPGFYEFHGPEPEMPQFSDFAELARFVSDQTQQIITEDRCPHSEIAVIYATKWADPEKSILIPDTIYGGLEAKGLLCNWVAENYRSKRTYDITTDNVTISTIHSVKGLDYACVFLLGLDNLEPKVWTEDQIHKLVYVAITRARYQFFIPYVNKTGLIDKLEAAIQRSKKFNRPCTP